MPTLERRLSAMDAANIAVQVLSLSAPNLYRIPQPLRTALAITVNDEFAELAAKSDHRLLWFASLPLPDVPAALSELHRVRSLGAMKGVILCSTIDRRTLDHPDFAPLLEELSPSRLP